MGEKEFNVKYSAFTRVKASTMEEAQRKVEDTKVIKANGLRATSLVERIVTGVVRNIGAIAAFLLLIMYFRVGMIFVEMLVETTGEATQAFGALLILILLLSFISFINRIRIID